MGSVYFYHVTRKPLPQTLSMLLEKALGAGWRIQVRAPKLDHLTSLDDALWSWPDDGFLPHAIVGSDQAQHSPIVLAPETDPLMQGASGDFSCLMALDGADVTPQDVATAQRVCILFDGHNPDAVQAARVQWKSLTDANCAAQYWSEETGSWQKKAEKTPSDG